MSFVYLLEKVATLQQCTPSRTRSHELGRWGVPLGGCGRVGEDRRFIGDLGVSVTELTVSDKRLAARDAIFSTLLVEFHIVQVYVTISEAETLILLICGTILVIVIMEYCIVKVCYLVSTARHGSHHII